MIGVTNVHYFRLLQGQASRRICSKQVIRDARAKVVQLRLRVTLCLTPQPSAKRFSMSFPRIAPAVPCRMTESPFFIGRGEAGNHLPIPDNRISRQLRCDRLRRRPI